MNFDLVHITRHLSAIPAISPEQLHAFLSLGFSSADVAEALQIVSSPRTEPKLSLDEVSCRRLVRAGLVQKMARDEIFCRLADQGCGGYKYAGEMVEQIIAEECT